MNTTVLHIAEQLKEAYEGNPWFGKNATALLAEAEGVNVFEKPNGQHSLLELLWHMINWREFTLNRLRSSEADVRIFEDRDWRPLDHSNKKLWHEGLETFGTVHTELVNSIQQQQDSLLMERVPGRDYTYQTLLTGIVQHDIYHLGQIAYLTKLLKG